MNRLVPRLDYACWFNMNHTVLAAGLGSNSSVDVLCYSICSLYRCAFRKLYVKARVNSVRLHVLCFQIMNVKNDFH